MYLSSDICNMIHVRTLIVWPDEQRFSEVNSLTFCYFKFKPINSLTLKCKLSLPNKKSKQTPQILEYMTKRQMKHHFLHIQLLFLLKKVAVFLVF